MLKIFQTFVILLMVSSLFAQDRLHQKVSSAKLDDNATAVQNSSVQNYPTVDNPLAPAGTVPFPVNFNDYGTNGNNMRKLVVLGDTIIVGQDINPDVTGPPPVTTTTRIYYQVSKNGGTTWLANAINTNVGTSNRWPNFFPIIKNNLRSLAFCGRIYINNSTSTQGSMTMVETLLGLGSLTTYVVPNVYRDFFGYYKNSTTLGGIASTPAGGATDSLVYVDFNYTNGTFGTKKVVSTALDANFRYFCAIGNGGNNVFAVWWRSAAPSQALMAYESTDGGNTFSSPTVVCNAPTIVNGDSVVSWFGADVLYKPNSSVHGMAFSTLGWYNGAGSYSTREGSKLLYWSPTINGGNPVVIMDYHKWGFMNDTALWNNKYIGLQVGVTPLSHPSLAWSDDGTVLYCAFSAITGDTSAYTASTNYNRNDIFVCKSTDDGATWSDAKWVAKSSEFDELYPTLSKQGNTATAFNIVYNLQRNPGSFTFNDNAPADTTFTIFKKAVLFSGLPDVPKPTVGIQNISSEVPANYNLMQNYPNPFNPSTTIRFTLPKASDVTIKVYNVNGQLVSTLANNEAAPVGTHEVKFNGQNLSSGVYFYTIEAGNFKDTKKMMLIK